MLTPHLLSPSLPWHQVASPVLQPVCHCCWQWHICAGGFYICPLGTTLRSATPNRQQMLTSFAPSWPGLVINWQPRRKRFQGVSRALICLTWDLEMRTVLPKTGASNSILSPPLSPTSQALRMLSIAHVSSAHHYPRCCQLANLDRETLLAAKCILPFGKRSVAHIRDSVNKNHGTVHASPSFALCHLCLIEFYELSASNRHFHQLLRQPRLAVGADAVAFILPFTTVVRATAPSVPGSDFLLSFKTMCETLLCRTVASVSLRMTEAISSPGEV